MSRTTDEHPDAEERRSAGRGGMTAPAAATSGQLLRHYRHMARLTQEELADRSGYSANYISKLERDQRRPPPAAVARLADVLGLEAAQREALRASRAQGGGPPDRPEGAPLVGRRAELAHLERFLAAGEPPVLLFAGEPGIGKTRLLDEAAARAVARGWRVVRGGCPPWEQDPYSPLTDALARSIRALPDRERATALAETPALHLLLPDLVEISPAGSVWGDRSGERSAGPLGPDGERRLLVGAVARYVRRVAGPAGTLLVLDDLQWAGEDALRLLATLVTSAEPPAIRLIAAYRDSEVAADAPLRRLVADLARAGRIREAPLAPLSAAESEQVLRDLLPDDDETRRALLPVIARRAGGVPFFLVSYAEDIRLREGGASPSLELPWTVAQVIRQRVAALPERPRELLGLAAVIGRVVPRALVTRVAGLGDEEALGGLETAASVRLLEEDGESAYRFVHDVIRETVEMDLSAGRKQLLHRRIGEALEDDRPADVDALAYHFVRSDDGEKALRYLELAGDEAQRRYAHAAAIGFYGEAVVRLDQGGRPVEAASVRERLGVALLLSARYDEAIDVLAQAAAVYRTTGDDEGVRRVSGRIAEATFRRGGGQDPLAQVVALADESDAQGRVSPGSLRLRQGFFRLLLARGAYPQLLAGGGALTRLGGATRNRRMEAMGAATQGVALIFLGRLSEGVPLVEDAVPQLLDAGQRQEVAEVTLALTAAHLAMGSAQRCKELGEQMLPIAQSLNDPVVIACHCGVLGLTLYVLGDWATGRTYLRQAEALLAPVKPSALTLRTSTVRATPLIWEGDWALARRTLQVALQVARAAEDAPSQRQALTALAELDLLEGAPHAAVARLAPLADAALEWSEAVPLLATLAWAALETGEVARAERVAQRAIAQAETLGTWFQGVSALRIQGLIAARLGRYDIAEATYGEGLRRARAMPFPYGEAHLLHASALLQRQRGDEARAREQLEEALGIFQRLGAGKDVARMRAAIRAG